MSAHAASASGMAAISSRTRSAAARYAGALVTSVTAAGWFRPRSPRARRGCRRRPGPAGRRSAAGRCPGECHLGHPVHQATQHRARPAVGDQQVGALEHVGLGTNSATRAFAGRGPSWSGSSGRPVVAMTTPSYSSNAVSPVAEVGGVGVLDGAEGEVGDLPIGREHLRHLRWDLAGFAGARPQRRRGPGRWPRRVATRGADVQGVLGGCLPRAQAPRCAAPAAPMSGHRTGTWVRCRARRRAPRAPGPTATRPAPAPRARRRRAATPGHGDQVGETGERGLAEQRHHPVQHLLVVGRIRIRPRRLVRSHDSSNVGPTGGTSSPRLVSGPSRSGPVATRTSWPARSAARIKGSIGSTWP